MNTSYGAPGSKSKAWKNRMLGYSGSSPVPDDAMVSKPDYVPL